MAQAKEAASAAAVAGSKNASLKKKEKK